MTRRRFSTRDRDRWAAKESFLSRFEALDQPRHCGRTVCILRPGCGERSEHLRAPAKVMPRLLTAG